MKYLMLSAFLFITTISIGQIDKSMLKGSWKCIKVDKTELEKEINEQANLGSNNDAGMNNIHNFINMKYNAMLHCTYIFQADSLTIRNGGFVVNTTYKLDNNTLTQEYERGRFTIVKLNGKDLVMKDELLLIYFFKKQQLTKHNKNSL